MFKDGLATKTDYVTVYNYNDQGEFTGESTIFIEEGTGIPAQSTLIPVIKERHQYERLFNEELQKWGYVEDHRGEKYYSTIDGSEVEIKELGKIPENLTDIPQPDQFHVFSDGKWALDQDAKEEYEKQSKINALTSEMATLRNDLIFATAMGDDTSDIVKRIKDIRELLNEYD